MVFNSELSLPHSSKVWDFGSSYMPCDVCVYVFFFFFTLFHNIAKFQTVVKKKFGKRKSLPFIAKSLFGYLLMMLQPKLKGKNKMK
jgi:hypothetical protein